VALYGLVNWARANGWLALYLPTANVLVEGGTYYKGEDGLWDTPEAARLILTAAKDNHDRLLKVRVGHWLTRRWHAPVGGVEGGWHAPSMACRITVHIS